MQLFHKDLWHRDTTCGAQGHYLWWWEASCAYRAFWQHSEFLVSAALAGR